MRSSSLVLVVLAMLLLPAEAMARKPITGTLSKRGFQVIALAPDGRAVVVQARPGFRLTPTASSVTLHLRDRAGHYAGPVVVGTRGEKVVVGVRAGAKLGKVKIAGGFGRARPAARFTDTRRVALARKGAPRGARNFGRVAGKARSASGRGLDLDLDGVPGAFDVDDDGDLRLDNVDRSSKGRAAASEGDPYRPFWVINAGLQISCEADRQGVTKGACGYAVNQNAAGPFAQSDEFKKLIDLVMVFRGAMLFPLPPGGPAELDCGGLSYCSDGGSGFEHSANRRFPTDFDDDGDKLGTMTPVAGFAEGQDGLGAFAGIAPSSVFGLLPHAGTGAVNAGDTFIEKTDAGDQPVALNSVFGTLPALAAWSDGTRTEQIVYPVPDGSEGSESNAFTITPDPAGSYMLELTIWRPQREAIPASGEGDGWIDLGGLRYSVIGKTAEQNRRVWTCPTSAYSTSDDNLSRVADGLQDKALDEPVNVDNTLTFTVDLTACLASAGITDLRVTSTVFVTAKSVSGDAAEGVGFSFKAASGGGGGGGGGGGAGTPPPPGDFGGTWRFPGGASGPAFEFAGTAANGASTGHFKIVVPSPLHVTGGTAPAGWSCAPGNLNREADAYVCTGGTLAEGSPASGGVTLDAPATQTMGVDIVECHPGCKGYHMVYSP